MFNRKVLLLNNNFTIISFIGERKAIRLLFKDKADPIYYWDNIEIRAGNNFIMRYPSVLKMKYYVRRNFVKMPFSRKAVLKRDNFHCQYCNEYLSSSRATIDHIIPKSFGGISSFINCVVACYYCNNKKGNKTLEQVGMSLINQPVIPAPYMSILSDQDLWHESWDRFIQRTLSRANDTERISL